MSYVTYDESPLLLTGPDAAFARNVMKNPTGFLDEFTDQGKFLMKRPGAAVMYGGIQPTTYAQSGAPGTRSGDWVNRFTNYAAAMDAGDRERAYAAINAEFKAGNGVHAAPLHLTPDNIGAIAKGIHNTRTAAYEQMSMARGNVDAAGNCTAPYKVEIGQPIQHIKLVASAPGCPILGNPVPHVETVTPEYLQNCHSISASLTESGGVEYHVPIPAATKLVIQSALAKAAQNEKYAPLRDTEILPVSAQAVKVLAEHVNECAKSGTICAIDAAKIGEHMRNADGALDQVFVGQKQTEIGTKLDDVISAAYRVFGVGSQAPFTAKTETQLREAIGASQGAIMMTAGPNAPQKASVRYSMYVGQNFVPNVAYARESNKGKTGVFEHAADHYEAHPVEHAVISAEFTDGSRVDTLLVPVANGVKVIGDHMHSGRKDGKHRKRRGHTAYDGKDEFMGMYH